MSNLKTATMSYFKKLVPGTKYNLTVLPPVNVETLPHYAPADAQVTCDQYCYWCKREKEEKRAIARIFGPISKKKRKY